MDIKKIAAWLEETGQPKFRLRQITDAVYKKGVASFEEITALPAPLRAGLTANFRILTLEPETVLDDAVAAFRTIP